MKKIPRSRNRETVRAGRTPSERAIALAKLRRLKRTFAEYIGRNFGHLAVDCAKCPTPCCADAQFVNVNITRLEAVAMLEALRRSPSHGPQKVAQTLARARDAVARYGLSETGDTFAKTYACPLYEPGKGCAVHWKAKPAPCIQHGCYERWEDLPETRTLRRVERATARLDAATFGEPARPMTIPMWLLRAAGEDFEPETEDEPPCVTRPA
jgi:hypothetical protein